MLRFMLIAAALAVLPARAATNSTSEAVELLYEKPYLNPLAPGRLNYSYATETTRPEAFGAARTGHIAVNMKARTDGATKDTAIEVVLGPRTTNFGPLNNYSANPVLLPFFEDDLFLVRRMTSVDPTFFRRVFGDALLDKSAVEAVKVTFEGREIEARKITMTPFETAPQSEKLKEFARRSYEFIVGEGVPGGIYSMVARQPDGTQTTRLTLQAMEPAK